MATGRMGAVHIVIRSCVVSASLLAIAPDLGAQPVGTSTTLPVCQVIATGGTIAMKIDPVKNAPVPALSGEDLLAGVPELAKVARVRVESLFNIPSGDFTPERWATLQKA